MLIMMVHMVWSLSLVDTARIPGTYLHPHTALETPYWSWCFLISCLLGDFCCSEVLGIIGGFWTRILHLTRFCCQCSKQNVVPAVWSLLHLVHPETIFAGWIFKPFRLYLSISLGNTCVMINIMYILFYE